jgi:hypothetical protein
VKVFKFATGLAVGYVLGSRAGRDKYQQIVAAARKAQDHPAVTQAQQKAKQFLGAVTDTAKPNTGPSQADAFVAGSDPVLVNTQPAADFTPPVPQPARRTPKIAAETPAATGDPLA